MRRVLTTSALVVGGLLAAACSDQRSPLPTEPPFSPSLTAGRSCPSPLQLAALTVALFAPGDLLTFARNTQASISLKMSRGDLAGARKLAIAFIDFTLKTYYQGKLRDPNGPNPPTTAEAVVTLIDGILCWVGLPPSGLDLTKSADVTVTTKVIGKDGGQFKSTDELSGLKVPPGAVSEDRLFVITRRDDLATAGTCVSSKLKSQIPLCIDFAVVPAQDVAKPLVVAICQPENNQPVDRRLAHKLAEGKIELLAVTPDPFPLVCTSTPDFPPPGSGRLTRAVWGVGSFLARVLGPERLHAAHTGLGGLLGPKASPVTAVLVRLSFVVQPSNTGAGDPISPAVQVAYQDPESEAVDTEIVNPIHLALGANPGPASLADTLENPSSGIATFADVRIGVAGRGYTLVADAFSSVFTGDSLLHIPATSSAFDIVALADLVIGDLAVAPAQPTTADVITLSGVVSNVGRVSAGATAGTICTLHFAGNGSSSVCGAVAVPSLRPGERAPVSASLSPLQAGDYTIVANVDSAENRVVESNEDNHATGPTFTVSANVILDQSNDPPSSTSYYCDDGRSIYQSFTPALTPLARVELRFRVGAGFPVGGAGTTIRIRSGSPGGVVLGSVSNDIPGPQATDAQILVPFDIAPVIPVTTGATYLIEWTSPAPGGAILGWMGTNGADPYPNGSYFGCAGLPSLIDDLNFKTYAPAPSQPN